MRPDPDGDAQREALLEAQRALESKHGSGYVPTDETELIAFSHKLFIGPLPHPELLAGYEKASPGCAERIVEMAEKQARSIDARWNPGFSMPTSGMNGQGRSWLSYWP